MSFHPPKGWTRESDELYIHTSGTRIARTTYQQKHAWFILPVDLNEPVLEFLPSEAGRDQAFAAFAAGKAAPRKPKAPAKPAKPARGRKPAAVPDPEAGDEAEADDDDDDRKERESEDDER